MTKRSQSKLAGLDLSPNTEAEIEAVRRSLTQEPKGKKEISLETGLSEFRVGMALIGLELKGAAVSSGWVENLKYQATCCLTGPERAAEG